MKNNVMVKQSLYFLKKNCLFVLIFVLLGSFLIHNFDSIGQDIGRHLKVGEIIWQTKEVPKTNLFSFTEPDFPFINHHWLSEVMFFGIFSAVGFTGLILVKAVLALASFVLLFFIAKRYAKFWPLIISFLLSIFIFIQRTEVRPEVFSFVILSFFLFALFRAKYDSVRTNGSQGDPTSNGTYLWFLPVLELFWVNLHIYFFIGPFLISAFLIDRVIVKDYSHIKKTITVLLLTLAATLINPNGIQGALLPFTVLNEYGYSIVENQTLSFLADFFSFNLPIFIFKVSVAVLTVSLILTAKKTKHRIFEIIISTFFIYAGFKMLRNLPLYALASFPVMAILLTDVFKTFGAKLTTSNVHWTFDVRKRADKIFKMAVAVFLVFMIIFVTSNSFYKKTSSLKEFGFSVPNGLELAVDFVEDNKIEGPMFNNFDVGGYLIWRLYPEEKVFVDNRPEAYSVKFFEEIYKPMQERKEKWTEFSEKYGINFIFFGHADATPWGQDFVGDIVKDPNWKIVYINGDSIILVKNNKINSGIISRFAITEKNAIDKTVENIKGLNQDPVKLRTDLSRFFYNMNWHEPVVYFANEVIRTDPKNPYPYLHKGLVNAFYADKKSQELAAENIKKAIDLGLRDSRYYFILGGVYLNLGRLESARASFKEAIRLDKNNTQAKELLNQYFNE